MTRPREATSMIDETKDSIRFRREHAESMYQILGGLIASPVAMGMARDYASRKEGAAVEGMGLYSEAMADALVYLAECLVAQVEGWDPEEG